MPKRIYERTSIKRGKYPRYSQTDKDAIIKAFNDEKDWKSVAKAMSIKEATAITWIRNWGITKPKGGAIVVKKGQRIVQDLVEWLENDPQLTLKQLPENRGRLFSEYLCKRSKIG